MVIHQNITVDQPTESNDHSIDAIDEGRTIDIVSKYLLVAGSLARHMIVRAGEFDANGSGHILNIFRLAFYCLYYST